MRDDFILRFIDKKYMSFKLSHDVSLEYVIILFHLQTTFSCCVNAVPLQQMSFQIDQKWSWSSLAVL